MTVNSPCILFIFRCLADEALFFEHMQKYELKFATGEEFASRLEIFANKVRQIKEGYPWSIF
jgi:hypothetical protein